MIIKYEYCLDCAIVNLPDSACWQIRFDAVGDNGYDINELRLVIGDKIIRICGAEDWCSGEPDLPEIEVGLMLAEIVDVVASKIETEPELRVIDITEIERRLFSEKYSKIWIEKGYIKPDSDME